MMNAPKGHVIMKALQKPSSRLLPPCSSCASVRAGDGKVRSPGMNRDLCVSYVGKYGNISGGGQVYLTGTDICVRPAMWVSAE